MKTQSSVARLDRLVGRALVRAGYSGSGITLVVAASGGPDSSALLHSLHRLSGRHRINLHVAHLHHDIRGEESDQDAQFVANLAQQLGLPATVEKEDPLAYQREHRISSFEQVTREMRYSFLHRVALAQGAPAVAVGHTADDQAETVLEHILRGSGLHGLVGMIELAPWPWPPNAAGVTVFRPLLEVAKAATVAYCEALDQQYRQDSDNYQLKFTRNRVRHELLPRLAADYNPRIIDSLIRLSHTAGLELDYLEQECDRVWNQVAPPGPQLPGEISFDLCFDRGVLADLHPALQRLLLRRGFVKMAGDARRLRESHLVSMSELVHRSGAGTLSLPRGIWLHSTYNTLVFSRGPQLPCPLPVLAGEHQVEIPRTVGQPKLSRAGDWQITTQLAPVDVLRQKPGRQKTGQHKPGPDELTALLSPSSIAEGLWVRAWRSGDRFQPLGMLSQKKLQDFFVDSKVPRDWRGRVPLVLSERGVAWVVGHRIAEWAKVAHDETTALQITFTR